MLTDQVYQDKDFLPLRSSLLSMTRECFSHCQPTVAILDLNRIDNISPKTTAAWLHPQEHEQLIGFKYKKRNTEWLGGRICAKQGLKLFSQLQGQGSPQPAAKSFAILSQESGKPFFSNLGQGETFLFPQLSISHSKAFATALCATEPCGIDIQYKSPSLIKVREKFVVSTEEQLLQETLPNRSHSDQLSLIWAGKEALKKMLSSTGMPGFLDLRLERVIAKDSKTALLFFAETRRYNSVFQVVSGMQNDAYGIALCCEKQ